MPKSQKDKSFVVFSVQDGTMRVSRWSGDSILNEIRNTYGILVADSRGMQKFIFHRKVGAYVSYALNYNFAIMREY